MRLESEAHFDRATNKYKYIQLRINRDPPCIETRLQYSNSALGELALRLKPPPSRGPLSTKRANSPLACAPMKSALCHETHSNSNGGTTQATSLVVCATSTSKQASKRSSNKCHCAQGLDPLALAAVQEVERCIPRVCTQQTAHNSHTTHDLSATINCTK